MVTPAGEFLTDTVIATVDYSHVELDHLDAEYRSYLQSFWDRATVAPSMLGAFALLMTMWIRFIIFPGCLYVGLLGVGEPRNPS